MTQNEISPNESVDSSVVKELQSIQNTNRQTVGAPQQVQPQSSSGILYAGFWARVAAFLIDYILLYLTVFRLIKIGSILMLEGVVSIIESFPIQLGIGFVFFYVFPWLILIVYFAGMHAWRGQTIGKMVLRIKVAQFDGAPVTTSQAFLREFARILSTVALGIGYLWMLWDKQHRTWHDILAKTFVIKKIK